MTGGEHLDTPCPAAGRMRPAIPESAGDDSGPGLRNAVAVRFRTAAGAAVRPVMSRGERHRLRRPADAACRRGAASRMPMTCRPEASPGHRARGTLPVSGSVPARTCGRFGKRGADARPVQDAHLVVAGRRTCQAERDDFAPAEATGGFMRRPQPEAPAGQRPDQGDRFGNLAAETQDHIAGNLRRPGNGLRMPSRPVSVVIRPSCSRRPLPDAGNARLSS